MKSFDPTLAGPFRIDWLVEADPVYQDDLGRAVAEKAEAILRGARFVSEQLAGDATDVEVRVWIEGASGPACVGVTWEPGAQAFGFHVLDETLRERIACIVFRDLPCVDADASDAQAEAILRATLDAIHEAEGEEPVRTVRVPVVETSAVDPGVER